MALSAVESANHRIEFSSGEVTGALGDSVTVLPIVIAVGALTPASLAHVLLLFGAFQVVWGVVYGLPLSVEPMKALAGLAIAGAITYAELAAAGLLAGVVLILAGRFGLVGRVERLVGEPVVRGIQLAVALLLARAALDLGVADPGLAAAGLVVVLGATVVGLGRASALLVLGIGGVFVAATATVSPSLPALAAFPAGVPRLSPGAVEGAFAQLAMTVGNAAVATSLLCADLFDREVRADDLATSMGSMCLLSVPLGGLPMCHGSGGLAGKHAFGARTGGANLVLGGLYVAAALVAGVVAAFPTALLGVLLAVVAVHLGRTALDTDHLALTAGVGVVGLIANVGLAFVLGAIGYLLIERLAPDGTAN